MNIKTARVAGCLTEGRRCRERVCAKNSEYTAGVDDALSMGLHKTASRQRAKLGLRRSAVELAAGILWAPWTVSWAALASRHGWSSDGGKCCHGRGVWLSSMAVQISGAAGIVLGAETWRGAKGKIAGRHGRKRWASCCSPWTTAARCCCCFMGKRGGEGPGQHGSYCCPWKINRTQEQQGKGGRRPALVLVQGKQGGRHGCWRRRAGEGAVQPWEGKESCSLLQPWEAGLPALACVQEEEGAGAPRLEPAPRGERLENLGAMVEEAPCASCCCREQRGRRQGVWLVAAREKWRMGVQNCQFARERGVIYRRALGLGFS
jgi:hypothetical protein